jgi:hypothetical protein
MSEILNKTETKNKTKYGYKWIPHITIIVIIYHLLYTNLLFIIIIYYIILLFEIMTILYLVLYLVWTDRN